MSVPSVLIAGANRGIGLEFARQYAAEGWTVFGTSRGVDDAELRAVCARVVRLDVTDADSVTAATAGLSGVAVDVLIANAGVSGDTGRAAEAVDAAEFLDVVGVNTWGPLTVATAFLPNLLLGQRRLACATSSLMSSIASNDWGTQYVYRASKSALNAAWRTLAEEWRPHGIACVLLRPGLVKTRMTGFQGIEPGESVGGMRRVIETLGPADSGRLIGYDGRDVPW